MIPPGSTLGLLGGGQLGRMFTSAATRLGYRVTVVDPDPDCPAAQVATDVLCREWTDPEVITDLAGSVAAVTTEFENIPADVLRELATHMPVHPGADALAVAQDRAAEKQFLNDSGIRTVRWLPLANGADISAVWQSLSADVALLKTARLGYDGKGQIVVSSADELASGFSTLGGVDTVVEERIQLACEISVMVARGVDGATTTWPVAENVHRNGILHTTVVPAQVEDAVAATARSIAVRVAEALEYVGVLCIECFVDNAGTVLVNEIAPRPHNSGHWTIDAAVTSQYEQQVRTLTGLPLGETTQMAPVAMVNILGDSWSEGEPDWSAAMNVPGCRLHLYGKREARPGRKMGHLTVTGKDGMEALQLALTAWQSLSPVNIA